jgi:type II secretory pathway predicted ATPase ExeA
MTRKQHVDYWLNGSSESIKDMQAAIKSKRRAIAMFCGHLAVEKML